MKRIAAFVMSVALVGAGALVGWELQQWHRVIKVWGEKAAAYDFVGPEIMERVMVEIAKQQILRERESMSAPVERVPVEGEVKKKLPAYPRMERWQHPA